MFDNGLTMKQQVDIICQTTYFETDQEDRIDSSVPYFWGHKTSCYYLLYSLVLITPLAGIPQKLVNNQHVKNYAVRLSARIQSKFALVASRTQNKIQ